MHLWEFLGVCTIIFLILEIMVPSMFFLNFALAALILAPISVILHNIPALVIIFFVLSFASFYFRSHIQVVSHGTCLPLFDLSFRMIISGSIHTAANGIMR